MSDEVSGYPGAPPGWYADPAGGPGQRWWDGYAWTETTVVPESSPPPPPPPPPAGSGPPTYGMGQPPPPPLGGPDFPQYGARQPWVTQPWRGNPGDLVGRELGISPLARIAIALPALNTIYELCTAVANASQWRVFGHEYRLVIEAGQNNQPTPKLTLPTYFGGGLYGLVGLIVVAALVIQLIWQYRAACTARALHWPSRRSPGWGVGFWFIPVVNFWMPYQAIRDCLPPGDPNRAVVLRYWLFWIGAAIGSSLAFIGLMTSTPVGEVFALIAGVCAVGVLATAPKVVVAIAVAHRSAVTP